MYSLNHTDICRQKVVIFIYLFISVEMFIYGKLDNIVNLNVVIIMTRKQYHTIAVSVYRFFILISLYSFV